jgi:hypothetical protein
VGLCYPNSWRAHHHPPATPGAAESAAPAGSPRKLEQQLQAELDVARTSRSEHRVRVEGGTVRRAARATELAIEAPIGIGLAWNSNEVGAVKQIEEFRPELGAISFLELPGLRDRKVNVVILRPAEDIAAGVSDRSKRGGCQDATARDHRTALSHITAKIVKSRNGKLGIGATWGVRSLGCAQALWCYCGAGGIRTCKPTGTYACASR